MAKQIKQIRWFGDGDSRNYPSTITQDRLTDKDYLEQFSPILQLSVHTLPGVRMYYNDQTDNPIYVGHSGVYQLDLQDTSAVLHGIHFDTDDLNDIKNTNVGLIIDLMYENIVEDDSDAETETVITSTTGMASVTVNTKIKNIHKNIWYGVNDKISPYIMERDSQLEKLKLEFAELLRRLKEKYQDTLTKLDPAAFPDAMLNCAACYERCMKEIIAYYTEEIDKLEQTIQDSKFPIVQDINGDATNVAVSQIALKKLVQRIDEAFNALKINTTNNDFVLSNSLSGQPDLNDLLGSEG